MGPGALAYERAVIRCCTGLATVFSRFPDLFSNRLLAGARGFLWHMAACHVISPCCPARCPRADHAVLRLLRHAALCSLRTPAMRCSASGTGWTCSACCAAPGYRRQPCM